MKSHGSPNCYANLENAYILEKIPNFKNSEFCDKDKLNNPWCHKCIFFIIQKETDSLTNKDFSFSLFSLCISVKNQSFDDSDPAFPLV